MFMYITHYVHTVIIVFDWSHAMKSYICLRQLIVGPCAGLVVE